MDSVTQFVLGAAVGEAVLGKKAGNKAIVWGGIGGTIPDLDVLLNPIYGEISSLMMHRGISHSLFFPFLAAPLVGYLVHKIHPKISHKQWTKLFFWTIFTHPLLDLFTGYGTGLLTPFYDQRFQLDTIFIIDPLYTLPIFLAIVIVLFWKRDSLWRQRINLIGLGLAQIYLLFTVYHKIRLDIIVQSNLASQQIDHNRYMTAPAPLNNFLWWILVEENGGYQVAYYSFFDTSDVLQFTSFSSHQNLLGEAQQHPDILTLIQFCKGYYTVRKEDNTLIFNDLRFGPVNGWSDPPKDFIFSFDIQPINGNIYVKRRPNTAQPGKEDFIRLLDRIKGI